MLKHWNDFPLLVVPIIYRFAFLMFSGPLFKRLASQRISDVVILWTLSGAVSTSSPNATSIASQSRGGLCPMGVIAEPGALWRIGPPWHSPILLTTDTPRTLAVPGNSTFNGALSVMEG